MAIRTPQRGRGRIPAPAADADRAARLGVDIRSGTPFFLTHSQLAAAGRRLASIAALVCARPLRRSCSASTSRSSSASSTTAARRPLGLPLAGRDRLAAVPDADHRLVFAQARLYARARAPPRLRADPLVARSSSRLITLAFALGTAATTSGRTAICRRPRSSSARSRSPLLRASYDAVTGTCCTPSAPAGTRSSSAPARAWRLRQTLGPARAASTTSSSARSPLRRTGSSCRCSATCDALPLRARAEQRVDELIVTDSDFSERELLEIVSEAHRRGAQVRIAPKTTELLDPARRVRAGPGDPAVRAAPARFIGLDWFVKRGFDLVVSAPGRAARPPALAG